MSPPTRLGLRPLQRREVGEAGGFAESALSRPCCGGFVASTVNDGRCPEDPCGRTTGFLAGFLARRPQAAGTRPGRFPRQTSTSRRLRRRFADVPLICPDNPARLHSARPAQVPVVFPLFYDSHTSSQSAEARARGRERPSSLSLFRQKATAVRSSLTCMQASTVAVAFTVACRGVTGSLR